MKLSISNYLLTLNGYLINLTVLFLFSLPVSAQSLPIDEAATKETKNLYVNLQKIALTGVLFGQQDVMASGIEWKNEKGRSDLKAIVGEYPAVFGWDLGKLEVGGKVNFDHVPFRVIPEYIKQAYLLGGINTLSWHADNPVNPEEGVRYKTTDSTIKKLFADPAALLKYEVWLDRIAEFALSLKGENGESIPLIFRPFHEHTGNWFWWGKSHCTAQEYIRLWRFTVDYLKDRKQVHNLIYAYSTDKFTGREDYLERYPGDDYVDLLGFDFYDKQENYPGNKFVVAATEMVSVLKSLAMEKKKPYAITEIGLKLVSETNWWTRSLLPIIRHSGLSYVLVWRNGSPTSYWGAYPGQASAKDFEAFFNAEQVLFQHKAAKLSLYQ